MVRQQLLPDMTLLDTEGRAVFGKTPIMDETMQNVADGIGHGISVIGKGPGSRLKLFCDGMKFDRKASKDYERQLGLQLPADYIDWVLVFRKDVAGDKQEESLLSLSNQQSAQLAIRLTDSWSEKLRAVLKHQTIDAASTLAFLTASPTFDTEWTVKPLNLQGRVTLMGDSAHPMPPVGGIGANLGFQDPADLCDKLIAFHRTADVDGRGWLIGAYEEQMLARAKEAVNRTSGGAGHFFGMRPISELKRATLWHSENLIPIVNRVSTR